LPVVVLLLSMVLRWSEPEVERTGVAASLSNKLEGLPPNLEVKVRSPPFSLPDLPSHHGGLSWRRKLEERIEKLINDCHP
jgi:hypothetical protein